MTETFPRYFTEYNENIFDVFEKTPRQTIDIDLKDVDGKTIYKGRNLEFPKHFSRQACEIIASKYFFKGEIEETSYFTMIYRMVNFWTDALIDEGLLNRSDWNVFTAECAYSLIHQMWSPNSPQYFNTGLNYYNLETKNDGLWYWDSEMGEALQKENKYERSQSSACFILGIEDSLLGPYSITDHYITETKLFKGGSGTGTNFSKLRAEGEKISSGGNSSGVLSFLHGLDRNAGAIKSGGTTRRAAKMVILDIDHPDIEKFIDWKINEEEKAKALIEAGYSGGMLGEAYSTVSGQNSNNSVRVNKEFMDALTEYKITPQNHKYIYKLKGRVDSSVDRWVDPYELWNKIAYGAWLCGDPGIQFDDRYNEWNTCSNDGRISATNPCSEFAFLDNTACNLASINLLNVIEKDSFDKFEQVIRICQYVLEASIHWGQFPTKEIAENSYKYRPTGLGIANLASFLLKNGIAYDSDEARNLTSLICAKLTGYSYTVSNDMADIVGPFERYEVNRKSMSEVLFKHCEQFLKTTGSTYFEFNEWSNIFDEWDNLMDPYIQDIGFRNAQVTVVAPTGTISFAMDCASTGIEPFFGHVLYKKTVDGTIMEIVNPLVEEYLKTIGDESFVKTVMSRIKENKPINSYVSVHEYNVLKTANEIAPKAHVKMMAAIQPFISGSISKTVNLPNDATIEDVKEVYELAYDLGCKSITVYRDGSKGTQPLSVSKDSEEDNNKENNDSKYNDNNENINDRKDNNGDVSRSTNSVLRTNDNSLEGVDDSETYTRGQTVASRIEERLKPYGIRNSNTHEAKIGGVELYITVGFYPNGEMSEIFVSTDKDGTTTKGLLAVLSKTVSHMLQSGFTPKYISRILRDQKFEPNGIVTRHPYIKMASSISDLISKIIDYEIGDYSRLQVKPDKDPYEELLNSEVVTFKYSDLEKYDIDEPFDSKAWDEYMNEQKRVDQMESDEEPCPNCGMHALKRSGTCKVCSNCGSTTGCS